MDGFLVAGASTWGVLDDGGGGSGGPAGDGCEIASESLVRALSKPLVAGPVGVVTSLEASWGYSCSLCAPGKTPDSDSGLDDGEVPALSPPWGHRLGVVHGQEGQVSGFGGWAQVSACFFCVVIKVEWCAIYSFNTVSLGGKVQRGLGRWIPFDWRA